MVTANNEKLIEEFFEDMKAFDVKDLGIVEKFLGFKVEHETGNGYMLSQKAGIESLIKDFGMQDSKAVATPTTDNDPIAEGDSDLLTP